MNSTQVKQAFAAAGIKVRVADMGAKFRICRIAGAGVDVAHDQAQSSTVAASLGLYDTAGKLGGQFNQAHEMVAYTKRGLALSFGMRV